MNAPRAGFRSLLAALSLGSLLGCNQGKPCSDPGQRQACSCGDGQSGSQQCLPERVLGDCDCSATMRPLAAGHDAGAVGTDAAVSANASDSGGSANTAKTDASSTLPATDDSGTAMSPAMSGAGGMGGMGGAAGMAGGGGVGAAAGAGGGGAGGGGGAAGSMSDAYTACSSASDCRPSSDCTMVTANALLGTPDASVCAPPCTTATDCPVPEGSYEAAVVCDVDQFCRLDCTPLDLSSTDRSCPSAMSCVASPLTASFCFH